MSTMKETQTQRPFRLEDIYSTYVKHIVPSSCFLSDLWVWVSRIVLTSQSDLYITSNYIISYDIVVYYMLLL